MKVKIKDQEIELHYTMRMMIVYENITGENIDFSNMQSVKQLTTIFLACIIASAKKAKLDFDITYDEFMDWFDDNGGYTVLNEFALWLANELNNKYSILNKEDEEKEKDNFPKQRKKAKN